MNLICLVLCWFGFLLVFSLLKCELITIIAPLPVQKKRTLFPQPAGRNGSLACWKCTILPLAILKQVTVSSREGSATPCLAALAAA